MKATITEEPAVYTIEVNGKKIKGMRANGELGLVRRLKNERGEQVYLLCEGKDFREGIASVFSEILGRPKESAATLIAASPGLVEVFTPPAAAAPAAGE